MFKEGDTVAFIDDIGKGKVLAIKGDLLLLELDHGFEQWIGKDLVIKTNAFLVDRIVKKDVSFKRAVSKTDRKDRGIIEKDLHIHEAHGLSNFDMLEMQLNTARSTIEKARRAHAKKVIFIHGVGEGKLREELHKLLNTLGNLNFYDASFVNYGAGATEVELW
jgi:dsDNA-specific endonuclease/ATPase MutS2